MLESPPDEGQENQKVEEAARREGQVQLVTGQRQGQQEHQTEVQLQIVYQKLHGSLSCESAYMDAITRMRHLSRKGLAGGGEVCYNKTKSTLADAEYAGLEPGQQLSGTAQWQDAARIRENDVTAFTSRGVFALLYARGPLTAEEGSAGSVRWLPQRAVYALREKIAAIWPDGDTAAFVTAELTGDRSGMTEEDAAVMTQAGVAHLFAVSGLHCAFLVSLLGLLLPVRRRALGAGLSMAVLLFYMVMVGLTPSVVRACIMQIFLLAAPLLRRESDGLTSLSAALLVILLADPFAAAGVSLQLSFAATLGLVCFSQRLSGFFKGLYRGKKRPVRAVVSFVAANLSASLAAMVFTIPLTACYFNTFSLIAPLSNLLIVPAAGWSFMLAFVATLAGFLWLPAAQVLGWGVWALVRYVLWMAWRPWTG